MEMNSPIDSWENLTSGEEIEISLNVDNYNDEKYIESFITNIELQQMEKFEEKFKDKKKPSIVPQYQLFSFHRPVKNYDKTQENCINLVRILINNFEKTRNERNLSHALRLIFLIPLYFQTLSETEWWEFLAKLITWTMTTTNINSLYASKCLQQIFYLNRLSQSKTKTILKPLGRFLVIRISALLNTLHEEISSQPFGEDILSIHDIKSEVGQLSKSKDQPGIDDYSIDYLCSVHINDSSLQLFHYMILLTYIIPGFVPTDFIRDQLFMNLIVNSMNLNSFGMESIRSLAVSIMNQCISGVEFRHDFFVSKVILIICSLTNSVETSLQICNIFLKMSYDKKLMLTICKDVSLPKSMLNYFFELPQEKIVKNALKFLLNAFLYNQFFDHFVESQGINFVMKSLLSLNGFTFRIAGNRDHASDNFDKQIIKIAIQLILIYLAVRVHSVYSFDDKKNLDFSSTESLYTTCIAYLKKVENFGGIRDKLEFFENVLSEKFAKWILYVFRLFCLSRLYYDSKNSSKDVLILIYVLSLYFQSNYIFTVPFHDKSVYVEYGTTLVHAFKFIFYKFVQREKPVEQILIQIYNNLLMCCFPDNQTYLRYLSGELCESYRNTNFTIFFESLIKNDLIYHLMMFLKLNTNIVYEIRTRVIVVKCLYLLSSNERACQIISEHVQFLTSDLPKTLVTCDCSEQQTSGYNLFYQISSYLVRRVNFLFNKRYNISWCGTMASGRLCDLQYDQSENLSLTYDHLNKIGLNRTAETFQSEIESRKEIFFLPEASKNLKRSSSCTLEKTNPMSQHSICMRHPWKLSTMQSKKENDNLFHVPTLSSLSNRYKNKISVYKKMFDCHRVVDSIPISINIEDLNVFKFSVDGKIIASQKEGLKVHDLKCHNSVLYICNAFINHIEQSKNGQLLLGGGLDDLTNLFSCIWKYNSYAESKENSFFSIISDVSHPIFSHSDKNIFGINENQKISMIDIETNKINIQYGNENLTSFYFYNSIEISGDDNLLYFNGNLFCTRSGNIINTFERFNYLVSGVFMPHDLQLLINSELWDLRTHKLLQVISSLHETVVKRTFNDDVIVAHSISPEARSFTKMTDFPQLWLLGPSCPGNSFSCHETKNFNVLGRKIIFPENICIFDVSRDVTKFITLINRNMGSDSLRIHELGYSKSQISSVDQDAFSDNDIDGLDYSPASSVFLENDEISPQDRQTEHIIYIDDDQN